MSPMLTLTKRKPSLTSFNFSGISLGLVSFLPFSFCGKLQLPSTAKLVTINYD